MTTEEKISKLIEFWLKTSFFISYEQSEYKKLAMELIQEFEPKVKELVWLEEDKHYITSISPIGGKYWIQRESFAEDPQDYYKASYCLDGIEEDLGTDSKLKYAKEECYKHYRQTLLSLLDY